jgi:hypothetical protein
VLNGLGIPRSIWDDNIKIDPQELGYRGFGVDSAGSNRDK